MPGGACPVRYQRRVDARPPKFISTDPTVAIAIQNRQHALSQKLVANAQGALQIDGVNQLIRSSVASESERQRLQQTRIERARRPR